MCCGRFPSACDWGLTCIFDVRLTPGKGNGTLFATRGGGDRNENRRHFRYSALCAVICFGRNRRQQPYPICDHRWLRRIANTNQKRVLDGCLSAQILFLYKIFLMKNSQDHRLSAGSSGCFSMLRANIFRETGLAGANRCKRRRVYGWKLFSQLTGEKNRQLFA